jgi:hypothetical protein
MTQKQLATAIDYAKNSIAMMERGELGISKVTEVTVRYLLVVESKTKRRP